MHTKSFSNISNGINSEIYSNVPVMMNKTQMVRLYIYQVGISTSMFMSQNSSWAKITPSLKPNLMFGEGAFPKYLLNFCPVQLGFSGHLNVSVLLWGKQN